MASFSCPQAPLLRRGCPRQGQVLFSQRNWRRPKFSATSSLAEKLDAAPAITTRHLSFPIILGDVLTATHQHVVHSNQSLVPAAFDQMSARKILLFEVNGCTGKMGKVVAEAALSAGLQLVPVSFSSSEDSGQTVQVGNEKVEIHGPSQRDDILSSVFAEYPDVIVVDYTVPAAVNVNAELYCKVGVPFVMGTTGGNRERLYKTVEDANVYAVISPQMGKQVVAFLAAMEIMADQFPGAFSGYSLQVMESHQASKLDTSGTAKAIISCFQKLGVSFDLDQIQQIRDPKQQLEMVGVPEEYLSGHAFHMYHLTSPDQTVSFEFQHNVCGRSIYAEGSIDAAIFLSKKVQSKADKKIYNMIDVLREGNMR